MKWKRQNQGVGQPSFLPRLLFLAAFFFGGVCLGQVLAGRVPDATGQELAALGDVSEEVRSLAWDAAYSDGDSGATLSTSSASE